MGSNWALGPQGVPLAVPKQPGVIEIVLSILLMVFGPVIGSIVVGVTTSSSDGGVSDAQEYQADGSQNTVYLNGGVNMGIWVYPLNIPIVCEMKSLTGEYLDIDTNINTSTVVQHYQLTARFTSPNTGIYTVSCTSRVGSLQYKVAPATSTASLAADIAIGVILIIGGFFGGLVAVIVTVVRRSYWRRKYGPQPYPQQPYPPQYPPQPYPPQQYPPQSYPPQ